MHESLQLEKLEGDLVRIRVELDGQAGVASTDTSCDSAVTGGLPQHLTPENSPPDGSPAG